MARSRRRRATRTIRRAKRSPAAAASEPSRSVDLSAFRQQQIEGLAEAGFRVSRGLPLSDRSALRPIPEIARRLMAIKCLMAWVCVPKEQCANAEVQTCVSANRLASSFGDAEKRVLQTPRQQAQAEHMDDIGWTFENAWPLAWILGYEQTPEYWGVMLDAPQIRDLLLTFTPGLGVDLEAWCADLTPVPALEVVYLEDTFYCLHNAVRSAQLGGETVPPGFDPSGNGGVIHERRHALTWALSPGVRWDETDLST